LWSESLFLDYEVCAKVSTLPSACAVVGTSVAIVARQDGSTTGTKEVPMAVDGRFDMR